MKLRALGCSGGVGAELATTSFMVDDDVLLDAGSGIGALTYEEMKKIRTIFLTHSHLDHHAYLPFLVDGIFADIKTPITIIGQEVTLRMLQQHIFNWNIWPDFSVLPTPQEPVMRYQTMSPGEVMELDGRMFEMIQVDHIVPGVGYRVQKGNSSFAFSGDTSTNDSFWQALNKHDSLDLLIVECGFSNAETKLSVMAKHYTPSFLADDLKKLHHDPKVFVTHLKPGREDKIFAECLELIERHKISRLSCDEVFDFS
jgi:ribonuclease BN (tRNA processing enzyme)